MKLPLIIALFSVSFLCSAADFNKMLACKNSYGEELLSVFASSRNIDGERIYSGMAVLNLKGSSIMTDTVEFVQNSNGVLASVVVDRQDLIFSVDMKSKMGAIIAKNGDFETPMPIVAELNCN